MPRTSASALFLFLVIASSAFAVRAQDLSRFADAIRAGTSEEKRTALFDLRNLRTAEASRIAAAALSDPDAAVRATAAMSVVFLPKDEAVTALTPNLSDKDAFVRGETASALGTVRSALAIDALTEVINRDPSLAVRGAALRALGDIGDAKAVPALTDFLIAKPKESNGFERRSAARSIGRIAQTLQSGGYDLTTPESFLPPKYKTAREVRDLEAAYPVFREAVRVLKTVVAGKRDAADTRREAAYALGAISKNSIAFLENCAQSPDVYLAEICREGALRASPAEKR
ncbi:MAG: HEAT repeat domain-containing protein [Acidobacteria bacterium]|nr:HEAT repeat domain-containing protein [Acidobacteriota bacterium]